MGSGNFNKIEFNPEDTQQIIKDYNGGSSMGSISDNFRCCGQTIKRILVENGVVLRVRNINYNTHQDIYLDGTHWYYPVTCPVCGEERIKKTQTQYLAVRNQRNCIKKGVLCKPCSLKGERNPFYGKEHTDKTKNKISKSRMGKAMGEDNGMADPKNVEKIVKARKKLDDEGKIDYTNVINKIKENHRLGRMIKGMYKSKQEDTICEILKNKKIKHKRHILVNGGNFDIYIPKYNLIIEYNGDYWHCNPKKYEPTYHHKIKNKTAKQLWERDEQRKQMILKEGYNFEFIWETDFKKNNNIILNILKKYEQKR